MQLNFKKMKSLFTVIVFQLILLFACSSAKKLSTVPSYKNYATIIQEGVINCFATELLDRKGKPINCEASAAFLSTNGIVVAEDKEISQSGLSQVFTIPLSKKFPNSIPATAVSFLTADAFNDVRKIEDMTKEPSGSLCFATTDFEWITNVPSEADAYNSILYWTDGELNSIKYISPTEDQGIKSSKPLRERFSRALISEQFPDGPPYYKIEGICALPDSTLLFGIRELGESYERPIYTFIILSARYHLSNGVLVLDQEFKKIYEYKPETVVGYKVGLSSITFNNRTSQLYLSTSYENFNNPDSDKFLSFLWQISKVDFLTNKPIQPLKDSSGHILKFNHKIEGITLIGDDLLFTVSDQDRNVGPVTLTTSILKRETNQAIFTIVKLD